MLLGGEEILLGGISSGVGEKLVVPCRLFLRLFIASSSPKCIFAFGGRWVSLPGRCIGHRRECVCGDFFTFCHLRRESWMVVCSLFVSMFGWVSNERVAAWNSGATHAFRGKMRHELATKEHSGIFQTPLSVCTRCSRTMKEMFLLSTLTTLCSVCLLQRCYGKTERILKGGYVGGFFQLQVSSSICERVLEKNGGAVMLCENCSSRCLGVDRKMV